MPFLRCLQTFTDSSQQNLKNVFFERDSGRNTVLTLDFTEEFYPRVLPLSIREQKKRRGKTHGDGYPGSFDALALT